MRRGADPRRPVRHLVPVQAGLGFRRLPALASVAVGGFARDDGDGGVDDFRTYRIIWRVYRVWLL